MSFPLLGEFSDARFAGKKATNLDLLFKAHFSVPPGFLIAASDLAFSDSDLQSAVEHIGGFPVAVRSSGTLEDLKTASFAGLYETILQVNELSELREAIQKCRASEYAKRAETYVTHMKVQEKPQGMSILVQKMVDAKLSGVAFTIHPTNGNENEGLIEWCTGLGEKLVSGKITPSSVRVSLLKKEMLEEHEGEAAALFPSSQRHDLIEQMLKIQAYFGRPQDIEWSIDQANQLWILQSRPITQIAWLSNMDEHSNSNFKDGGVSAQVCTPLMQSIYETVYQKSMTDYLIKIKLLKKSWKEQFIHTFYGRVYWNASAVKRSLIQVPGFDEAAFDADVGVQKNYGPNGPVRIPMNLKTILPAIPIAIALEKDYRETLQKGKTYGKSFLKKEAAELEVAKRFGDISDQEFFGKLVEVLVSHERVELDYFHTFYTNSTYQNEFRKLIAVVERMIDRPISTVNLLGGLEEVSHLEIQVGFVKLYTIARKQGFAGQAWKDGLNDFLKVCYFHGDAELNLLVPRYGENPERVETIIRGMVQSGNSPRDPQETIFLQKEKFQKEVNEISEKLKKKPLARLRYHRRFFRKLDLARDHLRNREKMREYSTRSYYRLRLYLAEAASRWAKQKHLFNVEDIFLLTPPEIIALAKQSLKMPELFKKITERRYFYDGYRNVNPPGELGRALKIKDSPHTPKIDSRRRFQGVGCSAGIVEGRVCVVSTLQETVNLGRDDILVTRFTDPGWTPVLGLVKAIVTEVGGLLSHAAIISREFGIPAVLNLAGATERLKSGQWVRIDGTTGIVEVIDTPEPGLDKFENLPL